MVSFLSVPSRKADDISIGVMARKSRSTTNALIVKKISASVASEKEETRDVACLGASAVWNRTIFELIATSS